MWSRRNAEALLVVEGVQSIPWTATVPWSGGSRPPRMCSSVLLPHPLGPIIATNSPRVTVERDAPQASRGGRLML